ncbi:MAG TPA: OPT/YSL family transporter, partial [Polyangiaceae bacterium]
MPAPSAKTRDREFTVRAVVSGALLGVVFAAGNVYVGLKTGLSDNATVTAAILGFAVCNTFGKTPYSVLENNITQSVSSSAATMPAAMGFLGSFPALTMMGHRYPSWVLLSWGIAVGLLGIAFALPLRERFLADDALPFPDAVATAEVIRAMHRSGARAVAKARALLMGGVAGGLIAWFRDGKPSVVPAVGYWPFAVAGVGAPQLSLGLIFSPLLFALGVLIGPRTGWGLFVGGVLGWAVVAPWLVATQVVADASHQALRAWLVWPGAALMIAATVTSLARDWRLLSRSARDVRGLGHTYAGRALIAPAALAPIVVLTGWLCFEVSPLVLLGSLALSLVMAVVVARSIGETAAMPLGSIGRVTQLALAPATPTAVASIVAASVPAGSGGQTGQTLETLKVGQKLGASPRHQIMAQLVGALVGAPAAVAAYVLLNRAYQLGGADLAAPTASPWRVLAELIGQGTAGMPPYAVT